MILKFPHPVPPESYSRELDNEVARQEMPYGYEHNPEPKPQKPREQD